jgi:KDO2-lipid IV(A) lauroyltransferase
MALYLVIQIGATLSRLIPRRWRYLIGTAIGDVVFWVWSAKRQVLLENMAQVFDLPVRDPVVRRHALKSMRNYLKYLVEFLELPTLSPTDSIICSMRIDGAEHLQEALARGKGVILASAHFGTIEVGGLRLTQFTDFHAVYDEFRPPHLDRLIQRKRREKGIDLIPVRDIRSMIRVLRGGGLLAMLYDKPVDLGRGVAVRFFGRQTAVPAGPAVLALKTGATILPAYMFRNPDLSFESVIYPPIEWTSSGERERDVQTITQRLMDTLEDVVRQRPDMWYMFRPMWPSEQSSDERETPAAAARKVG